LAERMRLSFSSSLSRAARRSMARLYIVYGTEPRLVVARGDVRGDVHGQHALRQANGPTESIYFT
jgi:hypothetical protein